MFCLSFSISNNVYNKGTYYFYFWQKSLFLNARSGGINNLFCLGQLLNMYYYILGTGRIPSCNAQFSNQIRVVALNVPQLTQASFLQKNQMLQNVVFYICNAINFKNSDFCNLLRLCAISALQISKNNFATFDWFFCKNKACAKCERHTGHKANLVTLRYYAWNTQTQKSIRMAMLISW